jgi:putative Mn2+ efflux pump MntP
LKELVLLVVFAVVQNIDNLVLAGAYRLKNVLIPLDPNLTIAALSGIATGGAVFLARFSQCEARHFGFGSFSESIGRSILVMIGVWTLVAYFRARLFPGLAKPFVTTDALGRISIAPGNFTGSSMSVSEAIIPGMALAVDNIAPSFAFGLVAARQQNMIATGFALSTLIVVFSVVSVWIGQAFGGRGKKHLHWLAPEIASGCVMIAIALLDPGDFTHGWITP